MEPTSSFSLWYLAGIIPGTILVLTIVFRVGGWHTSVNKDRDDFKAFMEKLGDRLQTIENDIKGILSRLPPTPSAVEGSSPLRLTEFGQSLAENMQAEEWAANLAATLYAEVQGQEPFQIDEFCEAYVTKSLDSPMRETAARCAYDFGVDSAIPLSVLRVVLRDALLKRTSTKQLSPGT